MGLTSSTRNSRYFKVFSWRNLRKQLKFPDFLFFFTWFNAIRKELRIVNNEVRLRARSKCVSLALCQFALSWSAFLITKYIWLHFFFFGYKKTFCPQVFFCLFFFRWSQSQFCLPEFDNQFENYFLPLFGFGMHRVIFCDLPNVSPTSQLLAWPMVNWPEKETGGAYIAWQWRNGGQRNLSTDQ